MKESNFISKYVILCCKLALIFRSLRLPSSEFQPFSLPITHGSLLDSLFKNEVKPLDYILSVKDVRVNVECW
jgi:hypothetical protein